METPQRRHELHACSLTRNMMYVLYLSAQKLYKQFLFLQPVHHILQAKNKLKNWTSSDIMSLPFSPARLSHILSAWLLFTNRESVTTNTSQCKCSGHSPTCRCMFAFNCGRIITVIQSFYRLMKIRRASKDVPDRLAQERCKYA